MKICLLGFQEEDVVIDSFFFISECSFFSCLFLRQRMGAVKEFLYYGLILRTSNDRFLQVLMSGL